MSNDKKTPLDLEFERFTEQERPSSDAIDCAYLYAMIDNVDNKQWVIDQMLRSLLGYDYDGWVERYNIEADKIEYPRWEAGIPPIEDGLPMP